jgi:hypothetical protein
MFGYVLLYPILFYMSNEKGDVFQLNENIPFSPYFMAVTALASS